MKKTVKKVLSIALVFAILACSCLFASADATNIKVEECQNGKVLVEKIMGGAKHR